MVLPPGILVMIVRVFDTEYSVVRNCVGVHVRSILISICYSDFSLTVHGAFECRRSGKRDLQLGVHGAGRRSANERLRSDSAGGVEARAEPAGRHGKFQIWIGPGMILC